MPAKSKKQAIATRCFECFFVIPPVIKGTQECRLRSNTAIEIPPGYGGRKVHLRNSDGGNRFLAVTRISLTPGTVILGDASVLSAINRGARGEVIRDNDGIVRLVLDE